jgi:uncharacterized C2H2 Zn-finger protein
LSRDQWIEHYLKHVPKQELKRVFKCKHPGCGGTFKREKALAEHTKAHDQNNKVQCEYCNQKFVQQQGLTRHMKKYCEFYPESEKYSGKKMSSLGRRRETKKR